MILVALVCLLRSLRNARGVYRIQTLGLVIGAVVPAGAGLVYVSGLNPVPGLKLPVLGFIVTAVAIGWTVLRHRLFSLVPVVRKRAFERIDVGILVVDGAGYVAEANPALETLFEYEGDTLVGARLETRLPEIAAALETGERTVRVETGSALRTLSIETSPLIEGERPMGRVVTVTDETDRLRRERRLREQNERLETVASVASHDLRNPLSVAQGYLELAREQGRPEQFDAVEDACDRMGRIIEDMLRLAHDGESIGEVEHVALSTIATEAWENVESDAAALTIDRDTELLCDPDRLLNVFENLFRNSVEHGSTSGRSQADGRLEDDSTDGRPSVDPGEPIAEYGSETLRIRVGATETGFYVADDGSGIPTEELTDVFDRGYTTNEGGTGFGLAIVREIVEAHGWTIEATTGTDGGARFEIVTA
ncbi:MAG: histidine kinase N-terminal 7TM domain-containing protein [Halalkalicoccus sp.]